MHNSFFLKHPPQTLCLLLYHLPAGITQTCWFPTVNSRIFNTQVPLSFAPNEHFLSMTSPNPRPNRTFTIPLKCHTDPPFMFWYMLFFASCTFMISAFGKILHSYPQIQIRVLVWHFLGFCVVTFSDNSEKEKKRRNIVGWTISIFGLVQLKLTFYFWPGLTQWF